jgi:hypothetical protein
MEQNNSNLYLLHSEFKNLTEYNDPSGYHIFKMDDWMFMETNQTITYNSTHAILTDGMEPFSYNGAVLRSSGSVNAPHHVESETYVVSKNVFKYNPTKYYRIRIRAKFVGPIGSTGNIVAGFVGLTTFPVYDLVTFVGNKEYNDMFNFSRCAIGTNGKGVTYGINEGEATMLPNFVCINQQIATGTEYKEFEGVIKGKAGSSFDFHDYSYGRAANKPMPVRDEVLFVAPYFVSNAGATGTDARTTFVDFITVEEITDTYTI